MFHDQVKVPCTVCRYCCDGCPMGINIPEMLRVYNQVKNNGPSALKEMANVQSKGKPDDCIGCGVCTGHCPQSIGIPDLMKELAEMMEKAAY